MNDADASMKLVPIGEIRTPYRRLEECPRNVSDDGPECRLVLKPCYRDALDGLRPGNRIEILYWLEQGQCRAMRRPSRRTGEVKGIFALRTPHRPNPIGSASVLLLAIDDAQLVVRGLDCLDGTKLIDIKPYRTPDGSN